MRNALLFALYIIFLFTLSAQCLNRGKSPGLFIHFPPNRSCNKFLVKSKFTRKLFRDVRKKVMLDRELPWETEERFKKYEQSKRDGILPSPKTSYDSFILYKPHPISELKARLRHIKHKLEGYGGEDISAIYGGIKKLTKAIRGCDEAMLICFSYTVFPSLYWPIRNRLVKENYCLRVLTLKDPGKTHSRRVYRKDIYPQTLLKHPYMDKPIYADFAKLKEEEQKDLVAEEDTETSLNP